MTAEQDLERALGAWLHEVPPHTGRARDTVLAQITSTRQHRRRWWALGTTARRTTGTGRSTRRSPASLSRTRLIAGIAIVVLGTGALYVAASPSPGPVPSPSPSPSPVGDPRATSVAAGSEHTCAVVDGQVWCWGNNSSGELGGGRLGPDAVTTPVLASGLQGATAVTAGGSHNCAIADGRAWCWGRWQGPPEGPPRADAVWMATTTPMLLEGLENVTAISAGSTHTCAVAGGQAWCWGNNRTYGASSIDAMLGVDGIEGSAVPLPIEGLEGVTAVAAGWAHSCAVVDGRAWCWGRRNATPTQVPGIEGITQISAGGETTCAVAQDRVWCWGRGDSGQLGDGSTSDRQDPVLVTATGVLAVTAVSVAGDHVCALTGGQVVCWGSLPGGSTAPSELEGVTAISAGGAHICAIADGRPHCWGQNWAGQLGDGMPGATDVPVTVDGAGDATALAVGTNHACAVDTSEVWCWGQNDDGQLGDGTTTDRAGRVLVPGIAGATAVTAGTAHSCAIVDAEAWCWGANGRAQLGDGSRTSRTSPARVEGLEGVTAISASGDLTCAVAAGRAWCWGANQRGQVGDGSPSETGVTRPTVVAGIDGVTAIGAGQSHACALVAGEVWCWGRIAGVGWDAPEGTDVSLVPGRVDGLEDVTAIGVGVEHACAVVEGQVWCWGGNWRGQVGSGPISDEPFAEPTLVDGIEGVTSVTAGMGRTCAISAGEAWCWGGNEFGALGAGIAADASTRPVRVVGLAGVTAVIPAGDHTCAIAFGQVSCWGAMDNQSGSAVPVAVPWLGDADAPASTP